MKRISTYSIIALLQASVALAQTPVSLAQTSPKPKLQKREKYEWQGEIPTYVEVLKKELTYPMAWGNSPIRNFKKWKKTARAKVLECMMTPPKADFLFCGTFLFNQEDSVVTGDGSKNLRNITIVYVIGNATCISRTGLDHDHVPGEVD